MANRNLQRTLNGLRVYCSLKDSGCRWEGQLSKLEQHLNINPTDENRQFGCLLVKIECLYCRQVFQRQFVLEHEVNECSKRPFRCSYCGKYESTYDDVTNSHVPSCPDRPVTCYNECGEILLLKDLDQHLTRDCPLEVTDCCFSYAGCKERLVRKDMKAHVDQNVALHLSLQTVCHRKQMMKLESQLSELKSENAKLKRQVERLQFDQQLMQEQSWIVPVHFTVKNISSIMYKDRSWVSRSFYTHRYGYKIRLIVDSGRVGATYLSVFIKLLSGEYDDELEWPFQSSVYVELLDQNEGTEHHSKVIDFSTAPKDLCRQVMNERNNSSWGATKFISHSELSPKYLKNDCLHFKVSQVK